MEGILVGLESIAKKIKAIPGRQVQNSRIKKELRGIIKDYYDNVRPGLEKQNFEDLSIIDGGFQEIYRATSIRAAKAMYLEEIGAVVETLRRLEFSLITKNVKLFPGERIWTDKEKKIFETLKRDFPEAARCFEQGLHDLEGIRISWRGVAVEFREALREVLDKMAPDSDVTKQPGFKFEKDGKGLELRSPTQKQKATYIFRSRHGKGAKAQLPIDALETVDGLVANFVRSVYSLGSVHTHVSSERNEVVRVKEFAVIALAELLEIGE